MKLFRTINKNTVTESGFALPAVLLISVALLVIGLSLVQSGTSIKNALGDQYHNRLADEAAQAGIAYASHCLSKNSHTQTWGPFASKSNLTQATDCNGSASTTPTTSLVSGTNIRSRFEVGDLETRDDGAIIIVSKGFVELLRSDGAVYRSYAASTKKLVQWNAYKATYTASGAYRTCGVMSNTVYCWGQNNFGQLGDGTTTDSLVPSKVVKEDGALAGKTIDALFTAMYHNCALANGKVYCWGLNGDGQLGNGTFVNSSKPVEVGGLLAGKTVTAIGGSGYSSCAIAEGKIYCWGYNYWGSLGNGTTVRSNTPTLTSNTKLDTAYGAGGWSATALHKSGTDSYNMCAIVNGDAWCWGPNEAGQIGNGSYGWTYYPSPTQVLKEAGVLAGKTVTSITLNGQSPYESEYDYQTHVCAVADGAAYCWGENYHGQLGVGDANLRLKPTAVTTTLGSAALSGKVVQEIVAGSNHTCALANSKAYCWGRNEQGQLGRNTTSYGHTTPGAVYEEANALLGKTVTAISGGADRGCALANNQSFCWGYNGQGQIGDGTTTDRLKPTLSTFLQPKAPTFIF